MSRRVCTGCSATHGGARDNYRRDALASTTARLAQRWAVPNERGFPVMPWWLDEYLERRLAGLYWVGVVER